jgi:hypothetical protein
VIIFEATLRAGQKMTGAQRDKLWNDAEQTAMEQQLPFGPVPAVLQKARALVALELRRSALEIRGMI